MQQQGREPVADGLHDRGGDDPGGQHVLVELPQCVDHEAEDQQQAHHQAPAAQQVTQVAGLVDPEGDAARVAQHEGEDGQHHFLGAQGMPGGHGDQQQAGHRQDGVDD